MKVSVITPTTGNPLFANCIKSVNEQTYENIQHLIFIDGPTNADKAYNQLEDANVLGVGKVDVIDLPYSIGKDRWNGHRMYGAANFIADGDFFIWLDEDNFLSPNHVESLVNLVQKEKLDWAYSFRNIVDTQHNFLCEDNCENLGVWKSVLNDNFVDVNCFFIKKELSVQLAPIWYRKAREPNVPEVDRVLSAVLFDVKNNLKYNTTKQYTLNYTAANSTVSVQPEFFIRGNEEMMKRYNGALPWRNEI